MVMNSGATRYSVLTAQGPLPSLGMTASAVDTLQTDWILLTEWFLGHYALRSAGTSNTALVTAVCLPKGRQDILDVWQRCQSQECVIVSMIGLGCTELSNCKKKFQGSIELTVSTNIQV